MTLPTPHKTIWSVIPIFLMIGFIFRHSTMDIQYHDTYFVFSAFHLSIFFSTILLVLGFIYWQNRHKKLIPWMTLIHLWWTVMVFGFLQIYAAFGTSGTYEQYVYMGERIFILILLTVVVQILLLINVLRSKS